MQLDVVVGVKVDYVKKMLEHTGFVEDDRANELVAEASANVVMQFTFISEVKITLQGSYFGHDFLLVW